MKTKTPRVLLDAREAAACVQKLISSDESLYNELGRRLRELNPRVIATVARGSSDHAAGFATYLLPMIAGKVVASIPPSVVTVLNSPLDLDGEMLLAISQSGGSPDILQTLERIKKSGALTVSIVNDVNSALAKATEYLLPQYAGSEGIAATKSVLCSLTAVARLLGTWCKNVELSDAIMELPEKLEEAFSIGEKFSVNELKGISSVYVLSRGLGLCVAQELALKLKETCGVHAEAYSTAEVRHGPREIVNDDFLVIALSLPSSGESDVRAAAEELRAQGARVMLVDHGLVPTDCHPFVAPLVYLQAMYPWVIQSSLALGHDPDHPRTLKSKVIKTV